MPPRITLYRAEDLRGILAVERESFGQDAWPAEAFRQYAQSCAALFLVARRGDRVRGYSVTCLRNGRAQLDSLAVAKQDRGRGVARALLARTEHKLQRAGVGEIVLMVRRDNEAAIRLYRRLGYVRVRTVPGYYEDGSTGWRMKKRVGAG